MTRRRLARAGALRFDGSMAKSSKDQDEYTKEETARRRDAVVKRMLETPPQPKRGRPEEGDSKERRSVAD